MENKNIITFCSCKASQKKNSIEDHENLLALIKKAWEVLDELQDTILKDRKVNKLWQKLFNQH